MTSTDLLSVRDLSTTFIAPEGPLRAVERVSFDVRHGEVVGVVGESGSGKTVTALSVMGLVDHPGRIVGGSAHFKGIDLVEKSEAELRRIRGKEIAMIWQDPMASLNPVKRIGEQIAEAIRLHGLADGSRADDAGSRKGWPSRWMTGIGKRRIRERVLKVLDEVNVPDPPTRALEYPHQLSGGMQQRVMIGMALACEPSLLIADEPTTALDVTIQFQILELLRRLQREKGMSMLLITHDLGIVAEMCRRVQVMYAGRIVESADTPALFDQPAHPYTRGLLRSVPRRDTRKGELVSIEGMVPDLRNIPPGCPFHPRCPDALPVCREREPAMVRLSPGHAVKCHLHA